MLVISASNNINPEYFQKDEILTTSVILNVFRNGTALVCLSFL